MTGSPSETSGETTAERSQPAPPQRLNRLGGGPALAAEAAPPALSLREFLTEPDQRLRDLIAFGLAVEAGKAPAPDGVPGLRRKAEADLHAHAFRLLHNQVEEIRRQAVEDHQARSPRPLSFARAVLANLFALALGGLVLAGLLALDPTLPGRLAGQIAQLLPRS